LFCFSYFHSINATEARTYRTRERYIFSTRIQKEGGLYKNIMLAFKPNTPETMHPSNVEGKLQAVACPPDLS
jgi:hypothetical protein